MAGMTQEDMENLASWLQEILKEIQETRNISLDVQQKVHPIQDIYNYAARDEGGGSESDRRLDDMRNRLESKLDQVSREVNEIKSMVNDLRSKIR